MNKKYSFKESTLVYFILLILIFPLLKKSIFASEKVQVNFHYKRFNEDYSDWNLWVWEEGKSGTTKYFEKSDEYGKISTIEFIKEKDVTYLGFLLKKGDWVDKDINKDRNISLTEKKIDVYLLQGDENIYSKVGDVDLRPAIKSAELSALNEVSFKLTNPISLLNEEDIKKIRVTDHLGKEFKVQKILVENKEKVLDGTIKLEKNLDIKNQYFLDIWGNKKSKIVINGVFSDKNFEKKYSYSGDDLGVVFTKENSKFLLWAPTAQKVTLNIYEDGSGDNLIKSLSLEERENGVWGLIVNENLENKYYTYTITVREEPREIVDIYAKGVGINGDRGMILDLEKTNPIDWKSHKKPIFINPTDAIVYEVHIRDFSIDESSGIKNKGKFLGMVEQGTKNKERESTGLDYLKELGVTHVQILPFFDFASIDETKIDAPHFNWGYDPKNYNVP
ncbi:MAG: pullulanase-associated domain-containing protein, partial [Cetobacterium sp.]